MRVPRLSGLAVAGAVYQLTLCGVAAAQAQQPATLTLACKGTSTWSADEKPEPVSMGLIFNFTARSVQGFGDPALLDYPVAIIAANDVAISFGGQQTLSSSTLSIAGSIDRVTGDLQATSSLYDEKEHKTLSQTFYALQCRTAQRMF